MEIVIYTDASYNHNLGISACGFLIILDGVLFKHTVFLASNIPNIDNAEAYSVALAMREVLKMKLHKNSIVTIHVDNTQVINRDKLKYKLAPVEELERLLKQALSEEITINMLHVKAHAGDKFNSMIDVSVRKQLRKYLNQKNKPIKKTKHATTTKHRSKGNRNYR